MIRMRTFVVTPSKAYRLFEARRGSWKWTCDRSNESRILTPLAVDERAVPRQATGADEHALGGPMAGDAAGHLLLGQVNAQDVNAGSRDADGAPAGGGP